MNASRSARASSILMWTGHAAAFIGFALGYNEINPVRGLRWVALLSVGVFGVCIFASEMLQSAAATPASRWDSRISRGARSRS